MSRQRDSSRGECHCAVTVVSQFSSCADSVQTRGLNCSVMASTGGSAAAAASPVANADSIAQAATAPALRSALVNSEDDTGKNRSNVIFGNDGTVCDGAWQALVVSEGVEGPALGERTRVPQLDERDERRCWLI